MDFLLGNSRAFTKWSFVLLHQNYYWFKGSVILFFLMEHWKSKRQVFQQCQEKNNDLISFWIGYIGEQVKRNSFQMSWPDKNN